MIYKINDLFQIITPKKIYIHMVKVSQTSTQSGKNMDPSGLIINSPLQRRCHFRSCRHNRTISGVQILFWFGGGKRLYKSVAIKS